MKKIPLLIFLCLFCCMVIHAAEKISVIVTNGIDDVEIKSQVETTISNMLLELKSSKPIESPRENVAKSVNKKMLQYQQFYSVIVAKKRIGLLCR